MPKEFTLPDLGEGIAEAQILRVMVKEGDTIAEDQYLMEVETDKAAVEIPSPYAGVAARVHVEEGQTVNVGEVIITFDEGGGDAAKKETTETADKVTKQAEAPAAEVTRPSVAASAPPTATVARDGKTTVAAAPVVRRLARELGVNLDEVSGSGPGGRVLKEDVERHAGGAATAAEAPAAAPARDQAPPAELARRPAAPVAEMPGISDADKWGPIRRDPLNQIRKTIAKQMIRSVSTIPHVTHNDEVDITQLDGLRRQLNEYTGGDPKLTPIAFVIRACCLALRRFPIFNSSFDDEAGEIVYKDYVNIGIAVDSQRGLIVPVIRNADQLSLRQIAQELRGLADRIRANRFAVEDLRGGTFTITNVGALGGMVSTPIINHPEVAILGLGRSRLTPVVRDGDITKALMMPINLSFDHRATDGANAARFAGDIIGYLENPARFLLD